MRSIVLALCVVWSAAVFPQETRYRLERIVVEGSTSSEAIIRGESRLEEEVSYTEEAFRQAVYRVRRLPFVTDATYRIEPGVTAGGWTLVIRILQETPVFYRLDVDSLRVAEGDTDNSGMFTLGGRMLFDELGVIEGTASATDEREDEGLIAAFTYRVYDIYGTGAFASISLARHFKADVRDYEMEPALTLGWPLSQKQTLTLSAGTRKFSVDTEFDVNNDDDDDDEDDTDRDDNVFLTDSDGIEFAELRYWYESIDDPLFATRGVSLSLGPTWSRQELVDENYVADVPEDESHIVPTETVIKTQGVVLDAEAYRRLFGRNVGFLRLQGDGLRIDPQEVDEDAADVHSDFRSAEARAGLAHDFHSYDPNVLRRFRARLEASVGYRMSELDDARVNEKLAGAALVLRHRWGSVRLRATYVFE
jgi:hypothetical protein